MNREKVARELIRIAKELVAKDSYEVGDILYSSWGYDQTNVDFYQIVATTGKSVKIREIGQKVVRSTVGADYVVAVPNDFQSSPMTKRIRPGAPIKISSFQRAYPWDGKPRYQTGGGLGH